VKHQSRVLFADLRNIQKQQDQQVIQWGRLQLQNTTLATHSNVESRARKDLKMRLPENVELVRLQ
jgi:cell division protein FtsL